MSIISTSNLIVDIHGKAGTNIFRTVHYNVRLARNYQRVQTMNYIATKQRNIFAHVVKLWKILNELDRIAWNTLAFDINHQSVKYFKRQVSGFTVFCSYSINMYLVGYRPYNSPPDFSLLYKPVIINLYAAIIFNQLHVYFTGVRDSLFYVIQATSPVSHGIAKGNIFKTIDIESEGAGSYDFDESSNYNNLFMDYLTPDMNIFFRVRAIDQYYGFSSDWFNIPLIPP